MRSWCGNLPAGKATRKAAQKGRAHKEIVASGFVPVFLAISMQLHLAPRRRDDTTGNDFIHPCWKEGIRMYAQNCLVALVDATRSGADGTVCNPGLSANSAGDKTVRPCETCEGGSRFWALLQHLQEEARSSKTQTIRRRMPFGFSLPERAARSVLGDVGGARSQPNLEFHIPTSVRCSATSRFGS